MKQCLVNGERRREMVQPPLVYRAAHVGCLEKSNERLLEWCVQMLVRSNWWLNVRPAVSDVLPRRRRRGVMVRALPAVVYLCSVAAALAVEPFVMMVHDSRRTMRCCQDSKVGEVLSAWHREGG